MGHAIVTQPYDFYGRFYDRFEGIFKRRLRRAIGAVPFRPKEQVLDVGVGTGLSLDCYPEFVQVTGVDLSEGMLAQARRKVSEGRVRAGCPAEATTLLQADALRLPFADRSFDAVMLSHVVSTVPDPARCLQEALRVAREGATVVMVNHFRSRWPVMGWAENATDPICRKLGWRSDLSLETLLEEVGVEGTGRWPGQGAVFQIVYLRKHRHGVRAVSLSELLPEEEPLAGMSVTSA